MKIYFKNKNSKETLKERLSLYFFTISFSRLYPYSKIYDEKLLKCVESGIKNIRYESHHINISFNCGSNAHLWNTNKWYAWLSRGNIDNFYFDGEMPSKKTMGKLKFLIEEWTLNEKVD